MSTGKQNAENECKGVTSDHDPTSSYVLADVLRENGEKISPNLSASLKRVYSPRLDKWFRSFGLKSYWEVPPATAESYIWHGYRSIPTSIAYAVQSLFHPTNESLNVWTHLVPLFILICRAWLVFTSLDNPFHPINAPFWVHSFGCCQVLLLSSAAHTFSCLSQQVFDRCFYADYAGICLCAATIVIANTSYLCSFACYGMATGLPWLAQNSILCLVMYPAHKLSCHSRSSPSEWNFAKKVTFYIVAYTLSQIPCLLRLQSDGSPLAAAVATGNAEIGEPREIMCGLAPDAFFIHHTSHIGLLAASVAVYGSRLPERLFPGMFDIIGNSHQFIHVLVSASLIVHNRLLEIAMNDANKLIKQGLVNELELWTNSDVFLPVFILTVGLIYNTMTMTRERERLETATSVDSNLGSPRNYLSDGDDDEEIPASHNTQLTLSPDELKQLRSAYSVGKDQWMRSFGFITVWEAEPHIRRSYILHGYLSNQPSVVDCFKSLFRPANECLNVWTHFIPFLIIVWRVWTIYLQTDTPFHIVNAPFWVQSFGCALTFFFSSVAHGFGSISITTYDAFYLLDYAGISLCGALMTIANSYYLCPAKCYGIDSGLPSFFYNCLVVTIVTFSNISACMSRSPTCSTKMLFIKRYLVNCFCYAVFTVPCVFRLAMVTTSDADIEESRKGNVCELASSQFSSLIMLHYGFFFVSVILIIARFPEKYFPGHFDILGQSHQIFHVTIAIAVISHNMLMENAMMDARDLVLRGLLPEQDLWSGWEIYVPVVMLTVAVLRNTVKYTRTLQKVTLTHDKNS